MIEGKITIQITYKELYLIKQALCISEKKCNKLYSDIFESIIKTSENYNSNSQNDHARYWLDLAKDFSDLNKGLTIIINNP